MFVQACVTVIMDDSDEDDMPLVFKRNNGTTKQNSNSALKQTSSQKPDGQLGKQAYFLPFEGMDVPDLGAEADWVRREKAERKAKMAELVKKRKSEVVESVAKKVRATAEAARMEQDLNSLVAFAQKAISQGYLAMNAAFEMIEKEKSDLEAWVKAAEENTTKAEAKFLAAEKARVEMATWVQAKLDAEKKNTTEVEVKLAEAQAKMIDVALQIKKLEAERTRLESELKKSQQGVDVKVAEEARKLKMEYHAQFKTEVNGFYRDGWSEASQFSRASPDHKVWDVMGFKINLPYPEAAIPELKPLTPRAESDAEGEEMEGVEGQEDFLFPCLITNFAL